MPTDANNTNKINLNQIKLYILQVANHDKNILCQMNQNDILSGFENRFSLKASTFSHEYGEIQFKVAEHVYKLTFLDWFVEEKKLATVQLVRLP